ncbi:MAG: UvrD-helicase domain-containing protein [Gillisia sp.]
MNSPNTFTVYNASAGSGKTYTLVKQYLLLLFNGLKNDSYKNILAITFTNKAVAEMKSRVILNLNALAQEDCPENFKNLLNDLAKETGMTPLEINQKSRKILKSILHNYAAFDISTIDRFTHKIIRTFAKDLGIPVNFEVELNIKQVLKEAVDRVISRAGEDKKLTKALLNYTISKADDDKSWDISKDLFEFSALLTQENHQKYVALLKGKTLQDFEDFSKKLKEEVITTEKIITDTAEGFFELINQEGLEKANFNGGYLFKYFEKISLKDYSGPFGAKWQEEIQDKPLYSKAVAANKKAVLDHYQPQIILLFQTSRAGIFRREYLKEIIKNLNPLSLLSEISAEIENIKKERSLVLISDFNPTIAAEINQQPAPFIYERLGERYKNYFIDEFQDTSEMQWKNIIPLIDHALSSEHLNNEHATLTIVGDAKQSIYRFRGGKAEQFIDLYAEENPFATEKHIINLPNNYRSAEKIVAFNNSFFEFVSGKFENPVYSELFKSSSQKVIKEFPGYVNISFMEAENKEEELQLQPERVFEIVKDLESQGMSKSDICVLTRTRSQSFAIAHYLSEQGISIVSSESLLVSNSPEVNFINAIFEFSLTSEDKNLKWHILNYLNIKLDIENPHRNLEQNLGYNGSQFFDWLKEYDIAFDLAKLKVLTLYEAAEYIIRSFSLIEKSDAYLQFYLDFIFEKTSKNFTGIPAYLELWEQEAGKLSIVAPKTEHAVQIMTIHKSKGLEFPVVIYPFANTKLRDVSRDYLWVPLPENLDDIPVGYLKASEKMKNWGEFEAFAYQERVDQTEFDNINILYVAFTRASQQLYVISNYELNSKGEEDEKKVSGLLIGFLKSLQLWNESKIYEFGEKVLSNYKKEIAAETIRQEKYYSSPTTSNAVKLMTSSGAVWGSAREEAIKRGNLIHDILSEIDTSEDIQTALEKFSEKENLELNETMEIKEILQQVISHPELSPYFLKESKIYRERDIISPDGELLRPDRLIFDGKLVTIMDYKTGNVSDSHIAQMNQYAEVLSLMNFEVINKILIYINEEVNLTFV